MKNYSILIGILAFLNSPILGQKIHSSFTHPKMDTLWIKNLFRAHKSEFGSILADTQKLEVQIIYTQINRDKNNHPHFKRFSYQLNPRNYFYPASTVKLPLTALALEAIQKLRDFGLRAGSHMHTDSAFRKEIRQYQDTSSINHEPSLAQYIREILLVSDNNAYNRLYEFLGPDYINKALHQKGFPSAQIIHRLEVGDDSIQARTLNPIQFLNRDDSLLKFPLRLNSKPQLGYFYNTLKGKGYFQYHGNDSLLVLKPFNFRGKNGISLEDEQNILMSIVFPGYSPTIGFQLTDENRKFLLKYMSMFPRESHHPYYPASKYPDNYGKYILYGSDSALQIPKSIRIFNKIGQAYGYLIDNAYVVDFSKKIEFIVSVVINTNIDQIYNDNKYAYSTLGYPFMRNLGKYLYESELKRKRTYIPNLEEFKMDYSKEDEANFNP